MTTQPTWRALALSGLGLLAIHGHAQDASFYYGGLSVGQSDTNLEADHITRSLIGSRPTINNVDRDTRDTAYKLFGGYQLSRFFALEGGYFVHGKPHFAASTTPSGTLNGQVKLQGWNLDLVGLMPLTPDLSLLARAGLQRTTARARFQGTGVAEPSVSGHTESKDSYKFGVGLQYAVNESVLVRAEIERSRVPDGMGNHNGVNVVSLGLVFPFGRAPAFARQAAAVPAPVPPMPLPVEPPATGRPAPEPEVKVAAATPPTPPERRRVHFSAESLFAFEGAEVPAQGQRALDAFTQELDGTDFDTITVEGHSDRLGASAYNRKLSEQRAEAVKRHLVASGKVDASRITAVGKSESSPVTQAGACKGRKATRKLIACLQPDRRAKVEVVGSR